MTAKSGVKKDKDDKTPAVVSLTALYVEGWGDLSKLYLHGTFNEGPELNALLIRLHAKGARYKTIVVGSNDDLPKTIPAPRKETA